MSAFTDALKEGRYHGDVPVRNDGENPKDAIGDTKPPLHLIPASAEIEESLVMRLGAEKYGPYNWRDTEVRASVYIAAARRHLLQWFDGQDVDSESGLSHLAHARSCMGILMDAMATGHLVDDRPPPGVAAELIEEHTVEKGRESQVEAKSLATSLSPASKRYQEDFCSGLADRRQDNA